MTRKLRNLPEVMEEQAGNIPQNLTRRSDRRRMKLFLIYIIFRTDRIIKEFSEHWGILRKGKGVMGVLSKATYLRPWVREALPKDMTPDLRYETGVGSNQGEGQKTLPG